jgi:hypothetical protein
MPPLAQTGLTVVEDRTKRPPDAYFYPFFIILNYRYKRLLKIEVGAMVNFAPPLDPPMI